MHLIWAVGQEEGMYSHSPPSGLEAEKPSIPNFYKADELKYHGKYNRGVATINFFQEIKQDVNDQSGQIVTAFIIPTLNVLNIFAM